MIGHKFHQLVKPSIIRHVHLGVPDMADLWLVYAESAGLKNSVGNCEQDNSQVANEFNIFSPRVFSKKADYILYNVEYLFSGIFKIYSLGYISPNVKLYNSSRATEIKRSLNI